MSIDLDNRNSPAAIQDRWAGTEGAGHVTDAIDLAGYSQVQLALSNSGAQTAALTAGVYDVWTSTDCHLKVAATASDVTTATGYLLRAGNTVPLLVPEQLKVGAITSGATGTLYLHRVR